MKIGILTYQYSHNYGAFLQGYALTMHLRKLFPNEKIELINFNTCDSEHIYKSTIKSRNIKAMFYKYKRYCMFKKNQKNLPQSQKKLVTNDIYKFNKFINKKYDLIIVGSDEVWKLDSFRNFPNQYWLPNYNGKKISYAASSRTNQKIISDNNYDKKIYEYLNDFEYVGVRDDMTKNMVESLNIKNVHINCDPTFLYNFNFSKKNGEKILKEKFKIDTSKKTIGFMVEDKKIIKEIKKKYCNTYNYISLYNYEKELKNYASLSPFEWIDVISALDLFVTAYFHGVCFSIITGTAFIAVEKNDYTSKEESKIHDLLSSINLLDNYYSEKSVDRISQNIGKKYNYKNEINKLKKTSISFINYIKKSM